MSPAMLDDSYQTLGTKHCEEQLNMDSIVRKTSIDSLSSINTSIHSSRCSSMDHARDTSSFTNVVPKTSSSPPPTPIHTSRYSRFRSPPTSPRSFRSSRSSRRTTAPLKLHGLPKTPGVHSPKSGGRGGILSSDAQSPPFSPRSFRSIFSGSNSQSPSADSDFSTTTTILSVPETTTASTSPAETKHSPTLPSGTQTTKVQTAASRLYDRNIPRSKNHLNGSAPPPTPGFFHSEPNPAVGVSTTGALETRPDAKEKAGPLTKLASRFKGILSSSGAGDGKTKRNKSLEQSAVKQQEDQRPKKSVAPHWTEL